MPYAMLSGALPPAQMGVYMGARGGEFRDQHGSFGTLESAQPVPSTGLVEGDDRAQSDRKGA